MSTPIEVRVPEIGDLKDVPVIEILVTPGAIIEADAPLVTLESEKATIDVPAPTGGVVESIAVRKGERVSQGALILTIASEKPVPMEPDVVRRIAPPMTDMDPSTAPSSLTALPLPETPLPHSTDALPYTSPSVRARCRRLEIDPRAIVGSGKDGRILDSDLDIHLKQRLQGVSARPTSESTRAVDFARFGPVEQRALSRISKRAAFNLSRSWTTIPHVTNFEEADVTDIEFLRERLNSGERNRPKLTMLAFLIKASAAALREFPDFNASLTDDMLVRKKYCHIGFAVDTPAGVLVPVIRDVDGKGLLPIALEIAALATRAREDKLSPAELEGGCFTVSSLGAVSGTGFTPIINAPEIAILGAARARYQPQWNGSQFVPVLRLPLALSWDHRAVSGASAGRFLAFIASRMADPRLLLW